MAGKDAFTHHFDDFSLRMPDGKLPNEVLAKCMYDAKIDVKLARQIVETLENNGYSFFFFTSLLSSLYSFSWLCTTRKEIIDAKMAASE